MRVHLTFTSNNVIDLPIHHNHILQGFVYNSFADKTFAEYLHNQGFEWKKRNFKLFTFSRLQGNFEMNKENERIIFKPPVKFVISSIKDRIIEDLTSSIIKSNSLRLGKQQVSLQEVRMENFKFDGDKTYNINFLSPVTAYRTENTKESTKTHYFSPEN